MGDQHLVIGMGEIGSAIANNLLQKDFLVQTLDINPETITGKIAVLHICIPYSDNFVKTVKAYQKKYNPKLIIIYSTVPVGTTRKIEHAVHSPVEGKHPRLTQSVKVGLRWIGYNTNQDKIAAQRIWRKITVCESIQNTDWTEFLKLASTSKYGINIVWADYMRKVAEHLNMPYEYVLEWDKAYNELYRKLGFKQYQKFVLDPPYGEIGGHCIVPNSFLLDEQFPDTMLKLIKQMGKKK